MIDLTRRLDDTTVLWPGTPRLSVEASESIELDGSFTRRVSLDEHSGTHFDAPSHFVAGAAHVADVPVNQLVRPLHIIDFCEESSGDPDAVLAPEHVDRHESVHGRIEPGSAVFLRTNWSATDQLGPLRFPGFGVAAAEMLAAERGIAGLGIDTLGIDPGVATTFPVHRDVTLPRGIWHVENLTNLAAVPPVGAWTVVGVPSIAGASGFPARVLALIVEPR